MVLNEILAKQSILNSLLLKSEGGELSKELKVKIIRLRMALNKIRKQFEEDIQEFTKTLIPEELTRLQNIPENEMTKEEAKNLKELIEKVNSEYGEFIHQKGLEEQEFTADMHFTDNDFDEIVGVNAGNDLEINGISVKAENLMEDFYTLFVENKTL